MSYLEKDLRGLLILRGVTTASNCFIGPPRKAKGSAPGVPATAVFLHTSGGLNPNEYMTGTQGLSTYRRADVKVRVRSAPNDYATGSALAEDTWTSFQAPSSASLSTASTTYCRVTCFESAPIYMGLNDVEQDEWAFTVRVEYTKGFPFVMQEDGNFLYTESDNPIQTE